MIGFLVLANLSMAQRHLISDVQMNKSSVYVGEPVEMSISIYTSTWFTSSVNPGNIKVNDAFSVYFRSLINSKQINGQTYAGVVMYFHVFPYTSNDLLFPSLEFTVETPDQGGFTGVKRNVRTPERTIKVRPVPPGFDKDQWLVTTNMTVVDRGLQQVSEVKVGDVITRSIRRNVNGTVAELIPPIAWDTITGVRLYPTRGEVSNNKTKTAISASRTDGVRYLFEREGEVTLPEMELTWYNPRAKKLFKRTLPARTITVLANPDLGLLETVRDSLQIESEQQMTSSEENSETTILGLSPKQFLIALIIVLVISFYSLKLIKILIRRIQRKRQAYRRSEAYFFSFFVKSLGKSDANESINALYHWIDELNLSEPTLSYFVEQYGAGLLEKDLKMIEQFVPNGSSRTVGLHKQAWIRARKNYLKSLRNPKEEVGLWVNPR